MAGRQLRAQVGAAAAADVVRAVHDGVLGPDVAPPWQGAPPLIIPAPVTIAPPQQAPPPQYGCYDVPYTFQSPVQQLATYTDTITQPPLDAQITASMWTGTAGRSSTDWGPTADGVRGYRVHDDGAG